MPEKVGPELRLGNEEEAGINLSKNPPDSHGMIDGEEENVVCFRDRPGPLISCPGHRSKDDMTFWKLFFNDLQKRYRTKDLSDGCGMDPNGPLEEKAWDKTHSLDQFLSKPALKDSSNEKIGSQDRQDEC